jgi:hypothetical protein
VLPVDGSGISAEDYRFSLQSHFDFVVTDKLTKPLFAVEYDGAGHAKPEQKARDKRKNALCDRFDLSLLRINSRYMDTKFRDLDLLTYFVEVWFMREAFDEAQRTGSISSDDDFDPWLVFSDGLSKKRFPYWLSADAQVALQRLHKLGKIEEGIPSDYVGEDKAGAYRSLTWIAVASGQFATVTTGMRAQQFPVVVSDVLSQIAICELHERVIEILTGKALPSSESTLLAQLEKYEELYPMRSRSGYGRYQPSERAGKNAHRT